MKTTNITQAILTVLALSMNLFSQDVQTKIQQSISTRDYKTTISELQTLRKIDKKSFQANNYDYLLARISEKTGDISTALASYQAVIKRKSILKEYSLWRVSQLMRSSGNLLLEKVYLQQLISLYPKSLLIEVANKRLAFSNFESGNYETTINILTASKSVLSNTQNDAKTRESLVFIGNSQLQLGKVANARETFSTLIEKLPNISQPDDFALAAVKGLDVIDVGHDNFGKVAPQLSEPEHQKRGEIYQFNRDFNNARLHFLAIVQNYTSSEFVPNALYQIGRGFVQENRFNESIQYFERVQIEFPKNLIAKDALSQSASAFSKVNKNREAVSRYKLIIERFPNSDNIERAYLNLVDIHRDLAENDVALNWAIKTQETFRGKLPETIALFNQLRIRITQSDWTNALIDADKLLLANDLGGTRVPSGTNKAEINFLRGLILEEMQRSPEAMDVYLSIADGRGEYYGSLATKN